MTKTFSYTLISLILILSSCKELSDEDELFHVSQLDSNLGGIYFGLYKGNKYKFCDGDFMDPGCYTGDYILSDDTIILQDLKKHKGIPTNRFLIRRYSQMDSTYWQWKYPDDKADWRYKQDSDSLRGSEGDVFPFDGKAEIVFDENTYFVIRLDSLKKIR
jgi:hypothetical protein